MIRLFWNLLVILGNNVVDFWYYILKCYLCVFFYEVWDSRLIEIMKFLLKEGEIVCVFFVDLRMW